MIKLKAQWTIRENEYGESVRSAYDLDDFTGISWCVCEDNENPNDRIIFVHQATDEQVSQIVNDPRFEVLA